MDMKIKNKLILNLLSIENLYVKTRNSSGFYRILGFSVFLFSLIEDDF